MNNTVLIIGSASEIGKICALNLVNENFQSILFVKNKNSKNKLRQYLEKNTNKTNYEILCCDLLKRYEINNKLFNLNKKYKNINILINFAALNNKNNYKNNKSILDEYKIKNFKRIFELNLFNNLYINNTYLKYFNKPKNKIFNISTELSLTGSFNYPAYASSKAALDNTTMSLSKFYNKIFIYSLILPTLDTSFNRNKFKNKKRRLVNLISIFEIILMIITNKINIKTGDKLFIIGKNKYEIF